VPLGAAFGANATIDGDQTAPRVSVLPNGFGAVWGSSDSKQSTVRMQLYDAGGSPLGGEQNLTPLPSTYPASLPAIAANVAGTVAATWGARFESPRRRPIQLQRFAASGVPLGGVLSAGMIDAGATPPQPDLAFGADGSLLVAWCGELGDAVRVRRFDANGLPFTDDPALLPRSGCDFPLVAGLGRGPRLASSAGSFFLVWSDAARSRVLLQRFGDDARVFEEPLALETPAGDARNPAVAAWGDGLLVVAWEQDDGRIYLQRLAPDGRALERPFAVSAAGPARHEMPAVAAASDGRVAVAWRTVDGSAVDVSLRQMQRCGNGNVDPGEECDDRNAVAGDCCSPTCQLEPDGQACDDGRFCTLNSVCSQGTCGGGTPRLCDDGNACTADRCDEPSAQCIYDASLRTGAACDDGNACTQQDACNGGSCQGAPVVCDDGNPCTTETCDPGVGCRSTNADGASCDDGDQCTDSDVCGAGACSGTRVCGPSLTGGGTGGGGTGVLKVLEASRKGLIKVTCLGPRRAFCATVLFAMDGVSGAEGGPTRGGQIAKRKRARIGKKGRVVLKIKLNKAGRAALAASGNQLPVFLDTTVEEPGGTTRQTSMTLVLTGKTKGR
jgi:cysteine-rich repeat protein